MLYLLDSHALLWIFAGDPRAAHFAERLAKPRATTLVSTASLWEIAIKAGLGKLDAPPELPEAIDRHNFHRLPVSAEHAWAVRDLPRHHRDPFDRLLVAQARCEGATLVSIDEAFDAYDVARVW